MITLLLTACLGHELLAMGLARSLIYPSRRKNGRTPALYGLRHQEITLTSADGTKLKGWYVPGSGRAGIVLCHGFHSNRAQLVDHLPWLHRAGLHVLAFDFRGQGESGGAACTFGKREKEDVEAAVAALARQPGVDPRRIGAMGSSLGGAAVLLAAAETPAMRAVLADSTFARLDGMLEHRLRPVPTLYRGVLCASVCFWAERWTGCALRDVAPVAVIGRIAPRPILLIHGAADHLVSPQHAEQLRAAARGPVELWEVPGADHVACYKTLPQEYEQRAVRFFHRALDL